MSAVCTKSYVPVLSYSLIQDKMDKPIDSYVGPPYATQFYVSILSYSPM